MKRTIFKLFYELTTSSKISIRAAIPIEIISSIQLGHIIMETNFLNFSSQKFSFFNALYFISSIFLTGSHETLFSDGQLQFVQTLIIGYITLFLLLIVAMAFQIIRSNVCSRCIAQSLSTLLLIHSKVVFLPLQHTLFHLIDQMVKNDIDNYFNKFWLTIAVLFSVLNTLFALLKEILLFENGKTKNAFSAQNNFIAQITLLHKMTGVSLIFFTSTNYLMSKISSLIHISFCLWASCLLYKTLPFYNLRLIKITILSTGFNLSLSIISAIKAFEQQSFMPEVLLFSLSPLMVRFYSSLFARLFRKIENGELDSCPHRTISFAIMMKKGISRLINSNNLNQTPAKPSIIPYTYFAGKKLGVGLTNLEGQNKENVKRELYLQITQSIEKALQRYPKAGVLRIYLADIYLRKLQNLIKFEVLLETMQKSSHSLSLRISSERLKATASKMGVRRLDGRENFLDVYEYLKYQENSNIMKKEIHLVVEEHLKIWQLFRKRTASIVEMVKAARKVDQLSFKISKQYKEEIYKPGIKLTSSSLIYAIYLQLIRELPHEASQVMKKLRILLETPNIAHMFDVYSEKTAMLLLSLKKEKIGEIMDISPSAQNIFGVKKSQVIGRPCLELFLPTFIASKFKLLISNYLQGQDNGSENINMYAKRFDGMLFEVRAQFQLFPDKNSGLCLVLLLEKVSSPESIMITDTKGVVIECSKDLCDTLMIENLDLGSIKIEEIFPQIKGIFKGSNETQSNMRMRRPSVYPNQSLENSNETLWTFQKGNEGMGLLDDLKNSDKTNRNKTFFGSKSLTTGIWNEYDEVEAPTITISRQYNQKDKTQENRKLSQSFMEGIRPRYCTPRDVQSNISFDVGIKYFLLDGKTYNIFILTPRDEEEAILEKSEQISFGKNIEMIEEGSFADDFPVSHEYPQVQNLNEKDDNKKPQNKTQPAEPERLKVTQPLNKGPTSLQKVVIESQWSEASHAKADLTEGQSMNSVYRNRNARAIKVLKYTFSRKKLQPTTQLLIIAVYAIIVLIGALTIMTHFLTQNSVSQIDQGLNIVTTANQRLSLSLDIWSELLIIYSRATDARPNQTVARIFQNLAYGNAMILARKNSELLGKISEIKDQEFIKLMFLRDVSLWRSLGNKSYEKIEVDTFAATDLLINKYISVANFSNINLMANQSEILFALNNTANEYWISSERLIVATENLLYLIIMQNINLLESLFIGINFMQVLLFLCFSALIILLVLTHQKLFMALSRVEDSLIFTRIQQMETIKALLSSDFDNKENFEKGLQLMNNNRTAKKPNVVKKLSPLQTGKSGKHPNTLTILHLIKYLALTLLLICLISGLFWKSILQSISEFKSFEVIRNQVSLTNQIFCEYNLFFGTYYFMILLKNQTNMLVRNKPPNVQANESLSDLSKVNERLFSAFETEINENDFTITTLFKKDICSFIPEMKEKCDKATYQGIVGLLNLDARYYQTSALHLDLYNRDPSPVNAKNVLNLYGTAVTNDLPTLTQAFKFLSSYILADFNNETEKYFKQEIGETLVILGALILSSIITQFITIRRFKAFDVARRQILNMVPYAFFQNCRILKFYVFKEFNREVADIKDL